MIFRGAALDWLSRAVRAAGCSLSIVPMGGATFSSPFRIEVSRGDIPERFLLRVLDNREWLDVAHCRTNLAGMYGPAAADEFLAAYRVAADSFTYAPYWDLDSLLDMCLAGPSYYPPRQEFGLSAIPALVLQQWADVYLESVIRRIT